jgi:NAD(P)-dependent dehydrogenase (short-subunit alcohol dehydrogenase family)
MSVVLVTGTSSGIGLATAVYFARPGHDVHAGVRNLATATELTHAIETEKLPIRPVVLDVNEDVTTGRAMPHAEYLDLMRQRYGFEW